MGISEAIEEAREAAVEWRLVREMPKPKVRDVEAIAVHLVRVRAAYETRRIERETEPAPLGTPAAPPGEVDPWSVSVDVPHDGRVAEARVPIGETYVCGCFVCDGARSFACDDCGGTGQKLIEEREPITGIVHRYYVPCGTCAGAGKIDCNACRASARVIVSRFVCAETGTRTIEGLVHGGEISPELTHEISDSGSSLPLAATTIAEAEDEVPKGLLPPVAATTARLLERPAELGTRKYGQTVTVSRGWIVQLRLDDRTLYVWGEPPRVSGDDAPVGGNATLLWSVAAITTIATIGAIVYALM